MAGKTVKESLFEVQLNWLAAKRGILSAQDAAGILEVATPPIFGGEGKPWTPEHYFLGSITSCFMTTYLAFAKKAGFEISNFDCNIIGRIEIVEGKYKFTNIALFPKIYVADECLRGKAEEAIENTRKYCLIVNSVNADVHYHCNVLLDDPKRMNTCKQTTQA